MSFSEELPKKSFDQAMKRTSADYFRFVPEYRSVGRILNASARTVWKHYIPQANKGRGFSFNCPNVRADMSVCPMEASVKNLPKDSAERKEKVARRRFIVNILDRTPHTICASCNAETPQTRTKECLQCGADLSKAKFTPLNRIKVMEGGVQLFNGTLNPIDEMQRQDFDNADITMYDIVFTTSGTGRDKKITAIPQPPSDLDESVFNDPATGEKQELYNLDDLAEPHSIEQIELGLNGASIAEILAVRDNKSDD